MWFLRYPRIHADSQAYDPPERVMNMSSVPQRHLLTTILRIIFDSEATRDLALASMARDDPPASSTASSTAAVLHGGRNAQ